MNEQDQIDELRGQLERLEGRLESEELDELRSRVDRIGSDLRRVDQLERDVEELRRTLAAGGALFAGVSRVAEPDPIDELELDVTDGGEALRIP